MTAFSRLSSIGRTGAAAPDLAVVAAARVASPVRAAGQEGREAVAAIAAAVWAADAVVAALVRPMSDGRLVAQLRQSEPLSFAILQRVSASIPQLRFGWRS